MLLRGASLRNTRNAIGIAVYTYDGTVSFGITGDAPTTEDLDVLAAGIEDGMLELVRAAAVHSPTGRAG